MVRFLTKRIVIVAGIFLGIYILYALYVWFAPLTLPQTVHVQVPAGQRGVQTLESLARNNVIRSPFLARMYLALTNKEGLLQAGDYTFSGTVTLISVVQTLTAARQSLDVALTFREGITVQDMADYLREQQHPASLTFVQSSRVIPIGKYSFLTDLPNGANLEGFLFPDTYRVFPDAPASDIIKGMLDNFDIKLTQDLRNEIARQKRTIFDIVTLASIVEKEVPNDEDRAIVAGIFYKRLAQGMRLQSDATVNYITGKQVLQASFDDLAMDSPYNTYQHGGLPPGPIGNPGLSAITSVIFYKTSPYLYFLTAREDGEVIYSKTYDDHLANKRKYLPSITPQ